MSKISDLIRADFKGEMVDNCFFVADMNKPEMRNVPLKGIFEWIKEESNKNGLTVKLLDDNIIFITNDEI